MKECPRCKKMKSRVSYVTEFDRYICQACKDFLKKHPFSHIPKYGVREKDNKGRMICHICGRVFDNLSRHIVSYHNITVEEYKHKFGLNRSYSLASDGYKEKCIKNNNYSGYESEGVKFTKGHDKSIGKKHREEYLKGRVGMKYNTDK